MTERNSETTNCEKPIIPDTEIVYKRVAKINATDIFDKNPEEGPPFTYVPPGVFQYKKGKPVFNTQISVNWPKCPSCDSSAEPEDVIPSEHRDTDKFRIIEGKVENIKNAKGVHKVVHDPNDDNQAHSLICIQPFNIEKEDYLDVRQDLASNFVWYDPSNYI